MCQKKSIIFILTELSAVVSVLLASFFFQSAAVYAYPEGTDQTDTVESGHVSDFDELQT